MRLLLAVVGLVLAVTGGMNVLARTDPGAVLKVGQPASQHGTDTKSARWVRDWIVQSRQGVPSTWQGLRCITGAEGWDYECRYRDPRDGRRLHFGAYVLTIPSGDDVVISSGVTAIGRSLPPRPE